MIFYTCFLVNRTQRKMETFATPDEALAWADKQAMLGGYQDYREWLKSAGSFEEGTAHIAISRFNTHSWVCKDFTDKLLDFADGKVEVCYETTLFATHQKKTNWMKEFVHDNRARSIAEAQELATQEWSIDYGDEWTLDDASSREVTCS